MFIITWIIVSSCMTETFYTPREDDFGRISMQTSHVDYMCDSVSHYKTFSCKDSADTFYRLAWQESFKGKVDNQQIIRVRKNY
jgi:hypothetical protein